MDYPQLRSKKKKTEKRNASLGGSYSHARAPLSFLSSKHGVCSRFPYADRVSPPCHCSPNSFIAIIPQILALAGGAAFGGEFSAVECATLLTGFEFTGGRLLVVLRRFGGMGGLLILNVACRFLRRRKGGGYDSGCFIGNCKASPTPRVTRRGFLRAENKKQTRLFGGTPNFLRSHSYSPAGRLRSSRATA